MTDQTAELQSLLDKVGAHYRCYVSASEESPYEVTEIFDDDRAMRAKVLVSVFMHNGEYVPEEPDNLFRARFWFSENLMMLDSYTIVDILTGVI